MPTFMNKLNLAVQYAPRIMVGGGIPKSESRWENQYGSGHWNYLTGIDQLARYSVIAGYCMFLKPRGRILDVGCGEAVLLDRLGKDAYSEFVGIDISDVALSRARARARARTMFLKEKAEYPSPALTGKFDAIIFNEVLYYCANPLEVVEKYERFLNDRGIFIVSMHRQIKHFFIWKRLKNIYPILEEVVIQHRTTSCRIRVMGGAAIRRT
jgi:2-polyprenyl-3-methyl-5-hydroxy-6-metoxy-1,4-benzoquinol methylase